MKGEISIVKIKGVVIKNGETLWHEPHQLLAIYEMPRWLYDTKETTLRLGWIKSRFQYLNPRMRVMMSVSAYHETGEDINILRKQAYIKGQITKVTNIIDKRKAVFLPTLFLKKYEDTEQYAALDTKRREFQKKLELLTT